MTTPKIPLPLLRKSEHAVELARLILGEDAAAGDIEDQALGLLHLPADEMAKMHARLAAVRAVRVNTVETLVV